MIEILFTVVLLLVLGIGSYTDFRTREVPDWLNYCLIAVGILGRLLYSVVFGEWQILFSGIFGFIVCLGVAFLMFYTGQWGGGDAKMLMGIGAVLGFNIFALLNLKELPIIVIFLLNSLIAGSIFGILFSVYQAVFNYSKFKIAFKKQQNKTILFRRLVLGVALVIIVVALILRSTLESVLLAACGFFLISGYYLFSFIKAVEASCMIKQVEPSSLTEGDWILKDVVVDGKYICGPKDLGIEKKQIKRLMQFYKKGRIKKVAIKEGIPFVPSFLLGYMMTIVWGNILWILVP